MQPGLRIIKINSKTLIEDVDCKIGGAIESSQGDIIRTEPSKSTIFPQQFNDWVINLDTEKQITFTFREEVLPIDTSVGLGLEWKDHDENEYKSSMPGSEVNNSKSARRRSNPNIMPNSDFMKEIKISVSSYDEVHDPSQCKLNNPHNHWSPTVENENSRDVWITFDLGMKRVIDKIHIQGSQNHKQYVKSIWIDYSDDGCQWKSHPMRAIICKYYSNPSVKQMHWLNNTPLTKVNSSEEESLYSMQSLNSIQPRHDLETEV